MICFIACDFVLQFTIIRFTECGFQDVSKNRKPIKSPYHDATPMLMMDVGDEMCW